MKKEKISRVIGEIDEKYVLEAAKYSDKKSPVVKTILKWGSVAACFCLALVIAINMIPMSKNSNLPTDNTGEENIQVNTDAVADIIPGSTVDEIKIQLNFGQLDRPYKEDNTFAQESAIVWPWEYLSTMEKFGRMELDGQGYMSKYITISEDCIGDSIGTCTVKGNEYFFDRDGVVEHTMDCEVYSIKDVPEKNLVAVKMDGEYVAFIKTYLRGEHDYIKTLGELFEIFNLSETVTLSRFTKMNKYDPEGYFTVSDDSFVWSLLLGCSDAVTADGTESRYDKYISFTVSSEKLGIYKKAMYISEDGYMWTNLNEWGYEFYIGPEVAYRIISYVTENGIETEYEPYQYYLSGTVTEIGDGYILVDDSILCQNSADGAVFRVITEDIRLSRSIDYLGIKAGDIVMITFDGVVDVEDYYIIRGATSIDPAILVDGDILVEG